MREQAVACEMLTEWFVRVSGSEITGYRDVRQVKRSVVLQKHGKEARKDISTWHDLYTQM